MNSEYTSPKNKPGGLKCVFGDGTQSLQRRSVPSRLPLLVFCHDKLLDFKQASRGKVGGATSPVLRVNEDRKTCVNSCSTRTWCERVRVIKAFIRIRFRLSMLVWQHTRGDWFAVSSQGFQIPFLWKLFQFSLNGSRPSNAWIQVTYGIWGHNETTAPALMRLHVN